MARSTLFGIRRPVWLIRTTITMFGSRIDGYQLTQGQHG